MGCDTVVALGQATVNHLTLFGANSHRPARECQTLRLCPGLAFAAGETVNTTYLTVPQVRRTLTALGSQPHGHWGYQCGINERRVGVSCTNWRSVVSGPGGGLTGPDVVRLALERSQTARQAMDVLANLIARHGQGGGLQEGDQTFLIADADEAFAVETAGPFWAAQCIQEVRAASDVAVIRQDWDRLAPGLSDFAIDAGWWQADGSKLDFAGSLSTEPTGQDSGLRRWGRATWLLEQQNGHIDASFVRRLLGDHYDDTTFEIDPITPEVPFKSLCEHGGVGRNCTTASMAAELSADPEVPLIAWCAFGPPCICPYFPVFLTAPLPDAFTSGGTLFNPDSLWWRTQQLLNALHGNHDRWNAVRDELSRLQTRWESDVEEVLSPTVRKSGQDLHRLCGNLMQSHVERFQEVVFASLTQVARRPMSVGAGVW